MTSAARTLRGVAALVILLGVVVGVPVLLVALGLVPSAVPTIQEVWAALTARDDGQVLRAVLGAGAWVCWSIFTLATVAETWALVRVRPALRVPGLGGIQGPVAALLAMVVVGLTVSGAATAPPAARADRPPLPVAVAAVAVTEQAQSEGSVTAAEFGVGPEYVVERRDTLWALAERYLGDPLRYPEIVALNDGRIGPDNRIAPGTALTFPRDATGLTAPQAAPTVAADASSTEVVVEPGDCLWTIADDVNGDGRTWPSVWQANAGRTETGGELFDDPDLIQPGWTLTVPSTAAPAGPAPAGADSTPAPPPSPPATPSTVPPMTTPPSPTADMTEDSRPTSPPTTESTEAADGEAQVHSAAEDSAVPAAVAATTTLLGAVSLLALRRYRRRQFRHRRLGRTIPAPMSQLASTERALVAAEGFDVTFLDRALGSLARHGQPSATIPDVLAVSVSAEAVEVRLAEPECAAPHPWTADTSGSRWSLRRDARMGEHADRKGPAPFPGLVSVGRSRTGEQLLIDLERTGPLRISGDAGRAVDLLRYIAAELAHNSWSEMLRVDAVGLGTELALLNPDRLHLHDDGDDAVTSFTRCLQERSAAVDRGTADALRARVHDIEPDAWAPRVLLLGRETDGVNATLDALGRNDHRLGLAIAVATDVEGPGMQVTIHPDGVLVLPELGWSVVAHQLPAGEAAALAQLLAHAAALPGHDEIPSSTVGRIGDGARSAGNVDGADTGGRPQIAEGLVDSVLPLPDESYLTAAATTARDVHVLAPATTQARRAGAAVSDHELDRDLADWEDPQCRRPKLAVLGPVRVDAQGRLPERNPRRQFYTEVVAYLATRPDGATSEQYATALWPDEPDVVGKTKVRQSISVVRAWLGTNEDGHDFLPSGLTAAAGGRYRIDDAIVDAELFRRLRTRGLARGADGVADLQRALALVRGRPFELPDLRVRGVGGYGWLLDDGNRMDLEYAAVIVDVAHVVSTYHLGNDEPQQASAAAHVALRSGTFEDVPLLDLVAACDAVGNRAEADAYVARILANHDAEVEEDLPPRTAEVLFRRSRR